MENIEVENCQNCPFGELLFTTDKIHCSATRDHENKNWKLITDNELLNDLSPKWCPLRKSSITITLKSK